ncbi:MAG: carbohydrate binding family 9 domain-containing protein [Candidatus Krumholzibacteriia bacterium]
MRLATRRMWGALVPLLAPGVAHAEFTPNIKPTLDVHPLAGEIQIDGSLDDSGWQKAARAGNFAEVNPGDQTRPPVDTEVWVTYDEANLYLAFKAYDDPARIRASLRDRDQTFQDDFIGLMIDTYGTASWAYEVFANALGVQGDLRMTSTSGEDMSFDIIYYTEGRITDDGYVVEMRIPFRSLRFPDTSEQAWRVQFWRTHPRDSRRQYAWAAVDRDDPCFMCQFGTLTGIRNVSPGGKLEIMPSLTSKQVGEITNSSDPNSDFENGRIDGDVELGARYTFTTSTSGEITINPDFSQVEADADQIDVNTTFALFFPERRPFFQEGSDLYDTWIDAVYTRTINDPSVAGKLTGRMATSSLGFFSARDERSPMLIPLEESTLVLSDVGKSASTVGRFRRDLGDNSHLGVLSTNRFMDTGGGSNSVFGSDAQIRFLRNYRIETQWLASYTQEPDDPSLTKGDEGLFDGGSHTIEFDGENFWGRAGYFSVERHARTWRFDIDYWETSPTFRADNGFIFQSDNRRATLWNAWSFRPDTKWFDEIFPHISTGRVWNFSGMRKDEWIRTELFVQFKAQTNAWFARLWSEEFFRGKTFCNVQRWSGGANSRYSDKVQVGFWTDWGKLIARGEDDPVLGDGWNFNVWGTLKPMTRLIIEPTFNYSKLDHPDGNEIFSGYILRTRTNYQFTRKLFLRLVVQYNDFGRNYAVDPLLTYKINPFSVFFVGSTHDITEIADVDKGIEPEYTQTERQFFMKLQYLFRL